jgi:hypothetical protein
MVNGQNVKDTWKKILVILNGSKERSIGTPTEGQWKTAILNNKFNMLTFENKAISIEPYSCTILHQE